VLDAIGDNPAPTDPDGDGLYEDINGNGDLDANDVVVLFNHREDSAVTDQIEHFDFNGNGRDVLDFDDINTLFKEY
jgi:PKD repeat protein